MRKNYSMNRLLDTMTEMERNIDIYRQKRNHKQQEKQKKRGNRQGFWKNF